MKTEKIPAWVKQLPKKVTICGKRWAIKCNDRGGCAFNYDNSLITVGCRSGKDTAVEGLVHEISEVVHVEMRNRFMRTCCGDNGDFRFCMDHGEFDIHNIALVAALRNCGLLRI